MLEDVMSRLDEIEPLINECGDEELKACAGFLADRIINPDSYVTFLGETSSGKSTLINGLIRSPELIMMSRPSTGAITEVELCDGEIREHFAINKNASIEKISADVFRKLTITPDDDLQRLKLKIGIRDNKFHHMRIFDTPGYGSIMSEHEEILKDFLPNSDLVIYTVRYSIGVQENDYAFLGFLHELIREDTEVVLVINCCPESINVANDARVREICKYVKGIIGFEPKTFFVKKEFCEDEEGYPLPKALDLWGYISEVVNGEARRDTLEAVFNDYVTELYKKCDGLIYSSYIQSKLDNESLQELNRIGHETADQLRKAIPELINPTFEMIKRNLPGKFDDVATLVEKDINNEIQKSHGIDKDQVTAYVNAHLLPHTIGKYCSEIQIYIGTIIEDLNDKVNDYIAKQVADYKMNVELKINSHVEMAIKNSASKLAERVGTQLLKQVLTKFGGAGGANAGIANAASHLLKKIGEIFGKTFSRETHNALKHFLAKIGATSMRAVGVAITVFTESVMLIVDYSTWKSKLRGAVGKAVKEWKEKALPAAKTDIEECWTSNVKRINDIADSFEQELCSIDSSQSDKLLELVRKSEEIGRKIGVKEVRQ